MRILFVSPYPPSRIRVRGYGLLTRLAVKHEVTIAAQCSSEQERADVEALRRQGFEVIAIDESKRQAAIRSGLAALSALPLQVAYARSARFTRAVQQLCAQRAFDVLHVEHLRGIASMGPLFETQPLVWDAVDCISLLSKHAMTAGPSASVRTVARFELKRTRRYEASMLEVLPHVVVTSERDRQAMIDLRRLHGSADLTSSDEELGAGIRVLPNGVDLEYFRPLHHDRLPGNLVFSGKMSYHANFATALYLRQHIMPLIWRQRPETTLTIVGSKPPKAVQDMASDPRIIVTGYVDDMRGYVGRAEVMLSPMVYSVGIQNKVLEAMALGTPVVVAARAAEALSARAGHELLTAETAHEFAAATLQLLEDSALRETLGQNGRAYVERQHDWQIVADQLIDMYEHAIESYARKTLQGSSRGGN